LRARRRLHIARPEGDGSLAQLDVKLPFEDEEEVVGVIVLVPGELALHFDDHGIATVELATIRGEKSS